MKIVLRREANADLIAAAQYYETQRRGLGMEFIAEAESAFAALGQYPRRWRLVRGDVRRGLLQRFPYVFYYWERITGEELEILCLSHSKRHPLFWIPRHKE